MNSYLQQNLNRFDIGYHSPNVDHPVFRFYGRILRPIHGMTGENGERVLDFGCGQGAAINYFHMLGFRAYGVDISETDLHVAKARYSHIKDRFELIDPVPSENDVFFEGSFDVIICIQSLYYYTDTHMATRLRSLERMLKPGGIFYTTMMGTQSEYYEHSKDVGDGLRVINMRTKRKVRENYHINFTESEDHLISRFPMFEPLDIGFYSEKFRSDEGQGFHYLFVGRKS